MRDKNIVWINERSRRPRRAALFGFGESYNYGAWVKAEKSQLVILADIHSRDHPERVFDPELQKGDSGWNHIEMLD